MKDLAHLKHDIDITSFETIEHSSYLSMPTCQEAGAWPLQGPIFIWWS